MYAHNPLLTGNERKGRNEEKDDQMREFWTNEGKNTNKAKVKKLEKCRRRVMERQIEAVRSDQEEAKSDKWKEWEEMVH